MAEHCESAQGMNIFDASLIAHRCRNPPLATLNRKGHFTFWGSAGSNTPVLAVQSRVKERAPGPAESRAG